MEYERPSLFGQLIMELPLLLTALTSRSEVPLLSSPSRLNYTRPNLRLSASSRGFLQRSESKLTRGSRLSEANLEALEVEHLDRWNTQHDKHYKDIDADFKHLYKTIEVESLVHTKHARRSERPSLQKKEKSHEPKRKQLKILAVLSRKAKEFEDRLEQDYARLLCQLQQLREIIKSESSRVCDVRASMHSMMTERVRRVSVLEQEETGIKGMRTQNLASYLSKKTALQRRRKRTNTSYTTLIASLKAQADNVLDDVETKRTEIEHIKDKMRAIKTALTNHYSQILKAGVDCRNTGLRWVVLQLQNFEVTVTKEMFPDILDSCSIDILLQLAEKEREVARLQDYLKQLYSAANLENRRNSTKPLNDIKSRLVKIRSDNITKLKTTVKVDRHSKVAETVTEIVKDGINENLPISHRVTNDWNRIQATEGQLRLLKSQMEGIEHAEVLRVAHDYFSASQIIGPARDRRQYIAALSGEGSVERYLNLIRKGEESVQKLLECTKTFSFRKL